MYQIQYRDLFGVWSLYTDEKFQTVAQVVERCVFLADHTDIAYRVVDLDGVVVETIDFEQEFRRLLQR